MPRAVAVFLSLVFTLSALSQTLTQERRVVPPGPLTRAANYQGQQDVASNGHGFLVTWIDGRAAHGGYGYENRGSLLWASHFAVDGKLTSPEGLQLADGVFDARIASDGNDYLIAMRRSDGIYTQLFDDEGNALADALKVDATTTSPMLLVSNGSGYLLVTNKESAIQWRTLDRVGHPAGDPQVLAASYAWNSNAVIVTNDGAYHLIYGTQSCSGQSCSYGAADVAVKDGQAAPSRTLVPPTNFIGYVSAASSGDQFLVAWGTPGGISEQVFDASDNAVTTARPLTSGQVPMTVWWDGARYLVSRPDSAYVLVGQRIGRDGEPIDTTPFVFAKNAASQAAFSRGGGRAVVVWNATADMPPTSPADIFGRVVFDFDELAAATAEPLRLSNAPSVQHTPAAALIAGKAIRVWRGGDGNGSIEMAIDGGDRIVLSPENKDSQHDPDVAAIGDVALVVWRSDTRSLRRVLGVRVDANGRRLDEQPIVIDQGTLFAQPVLDRVSVATDGQSFIVAWSGQYVVNAKRIAKDGSLLDAVPIVASHNEFFIAAGVKVVWTGEVYVAIFALEDNHLTLHPPPAIVDLYAARITSAGVPLDVSENRSVYLENGAFLQSGPAVAATGNRVVVAFAELPSGLTLSVELHTVEVSVDPLPAPLASDVLARVIYPFNYSISDPAIAAYGNAFVVTWSQDNTNGTEVRAQLLDRGEPFTVADHDAYDVTVTPDTNGFTFTYARTDPEAGDVAQLFTRDLILPAERHRAVAIR